ncbi:MAG TPA: dephospho-CoA kinase [Vicinamibacterales bacterium]|nr:dephospho-CoA kinase [Vicinamibacterales bacterium]
MKRVALTGGIATGKSVVRGELEKLGVPTIDADTVARDVVAPGTPALAAIVARFGNGVLDQIRELDRRKLGTIVFANADARRDLERIVHPAVQASIEAWLLAMERQKHNLAVAVIPLLYETGRERDFDIVVTTACAADEQLRRVTARDSLSEVQARQRIAAQLSTEEKVRRADYAIWTDGSYDETRRQVVELLEQLARR